MNWIVWSSVTETAIVVIPEEAELIIPLVYETKTPVTYLLTYSAPVTRRMLHFNGLDYYAMPQLPTGWKALPWLMLEVGLLAGTLYFEYEEYDFLLKYFGISEAGTADVEDDVATPAQTGETKVAVDDGPGETDRVAKGGQVKSFTAKPLSFLQEWLALRRKGQDFTHTPMGYVCQGKTLTETHPFFMRVADGSARKQNGITGARHGNSEMVATFSKEEEDVSFADDVVDDLYYEDGESEDSMSDESDTGDEGQDVDAKRATDENVGYEG